jgi:plasmid replication initiation protein
MIDIEHDGEDEKSPEALSTNLIVAQSNAVNEASYRMSATAKKVLMSLVAQIDSRKPMPENVVLDVNEFIKLTGFSKAMAYKAMVEGVDELLSTRIRIKELDHRGKPSTKVSVKILAITMKYDKREGANISCRFHPDLAPYIHKLSPKVGEFTQYSLGEAIRFKSFYTIRLFELLMQWKTKSVLAITIKDYRDAMGLSDKQYALFNNLRRRVIEPSIKEINHKTDWHVEFKSVRKGLKINSLAFTFAKEDQLDMFNEAD